MKSVLDRVLERDATERKIFVCVKAQCSRCKQTRKDVPEDCQARILHALDVKRGGFQAQRRRAGKTTQIVEMANEIVGAGYPTYLVTISRDMVHRIKQQYGVDTRVMVMSEEEAETRMRGTQPGYILFDEVLPQNVNLIMRGTSHCQLVAAYFTPR